MCAEELIVLKFGGSVLTDTRDLFAIGQEIYRWIRLGKKVVAVVSAFAGETDRLFREARADGLQLNDEAVATLVATGETRSAAHLTLALDRFGLAVRILDAAAIELLTDDNTLDATPIHVSAQRIRHALRDADVVVIPGFTGRDRRGRVTLLGRGGSDLTALTVAKCLSARCRLIKDVAGLYEWDPRKPGPKPKLFSELTWQAAAELDGSIIQHKAVDSAAADRQDFEVAGIQGDDCSRVGSFPIAFRATDTPPRRTLRIGLLGAGTVGGGVFAALKDNAERFEVDAVLVRDPAKHAAIPADLLTTELDHLWQSNPDVWVDTTGDLQLGWRVGQRVLESGRAFVTANKFLVARFGPQLQSVARRNRGTLCYSAAVGGNAPALEVIAQQRKSSPIVEIAGILNGTTNFVLDRLAAGCSLPRAIEEARSAGFAETDVENDLSGVDAACKLVLLTHAATDQWFDPDEVDRGGFSPEIAAWAVTAARRGNRLRQVAVANLGRRQPRLSVKIVEVSSEKGWGRNVDEWNRVRLTTARGDRCLVRGRGAGRWPTAFSVVADLHDVARQHRTQFVEWPISNAIPQLAIAETDA